MTDEELTAVLRWRGTSLQEGVFFAAAARIEQITAERDEAWAYMSALQGDLYDAIMIKAERDRLRDALEYILAECTLSDNTMPSVGAIKYAAREALKGDSQ